MVSPISLRRSASIAPKAAGSCCRRTRRCRWQARRSCRLRRLRGAAHERLSPAGRARIAPCAAPRRGRGDGGRILRPHHHPLSVRRRARAGAAGAHRRRHPLGDGAARRAAVAGAALSGGLGGWQPRGLALMPLPLEAQVLAKCLAHWLVTGLPLTLVAPLLGLLLHLDAAGYPVLLLGLLHGTPS